MSDDHAAYAAKAQSEIERLRAELAEAIRERDGWKANCQVQLEETHRNMVALAEAKEVLRPFAAVCAVIDDHNAQSERLGFSPASDSVSGFGAKVRDYRRAAALLKKMEG